MNNALVQASRPPSHPILGNLLDFRRDAPGFLQRLDALGEPVIPFRLAHMPAYHLSSPEAVHEVLKPKVNRFTKGGLLFKYGREILGNGLVFADGASWRRQRRLMNPLFRRQAIEGYQAAFCEEAEALANRWQAQAAQGSIDVHAELNHSTLTLACRVLFGGSLSPSESEAILEDLHTLFSATQTRTMAGVALPLWVPLPSHLKIRRAMLRFSGITMRIIEEKLKDPTDRSLITLLLMGW